MVGNLVVAWGVVGRTCRDVVARREGEVLGSSFPFTNIEHTVAQGLLGEVHQESLSCTCNKLHM